MKQTTSKAKAPRATKQTRMSQHARQLVLLQEMCKDLTSTLDEPELLSRAASIISSHFHHAVVAINMLDEQQQQLLLRAFSAKLEENPHIDSQVPLDQGVIGQAATTHRPVLVLDTEKCSFYIDRFSQVRCQLACPILHGERLLGVLNIESKQANAFTPNDVKAIEIVAGTLAIVIENARAIRRVQELNSTKDALLERLSHDYQHIFENAMHGMSRSTPAGRFLIVNPAFARMLGYQSPEDLYDLDIALDIYQQPEQRHKLVELLEQEGTITDFETQFKRSDGQVIDVKINSRTVRDGRGRTLYYDAIVEEISERKRLQQQLQRRERMAMMGELAAAIAHEIRNPLAAVLNSAEELQARVEFSGTNRRLLEIILEEVVRLERIVRDFLDFARPSQLKLANADLHQILEKTLELVMQSPQLKSDIKIERQFAPVLPPLRLDEGRMIQVFLNVILNATQASQPAGAIQVRTSLEPCALEPTWMGQPQVLVEVSDCGVGIPDDCLPRIFEPFFTTKPSGTGLGLPIAKQILEAHEGTITVQSSEGVGTTVRILLPISSAPLSG
ncbi:MAG: ATP-binding protein [Acidobacteriota bacterium]